MNHIAITADQVDAWITSRYEVIRQRVINTCYFDDDVFQDTYISLRETGVTTIDLEAAFIKSYRVLLCRKYGQEMRYTHPDPLFFTLLNAEDEQTTYAAEIITIDGEHVDRVCRSLLNSNEYILYKLRYNVGLALREIAAYTGLSVSVITRKLKDVVARLRAYFTPLMADKPA